ncbi:MAG: glycosyltransferase family 4 protein [Deltaproteobacteria bacterium]|nr:glycosyltransferase family 4 protein [Deltaproteobacteria bacterium]NND28005.1 glycosyltransferase [Myxococcales bacterium]MBT8465517.1 glycosyltransferase family 4 protein [Deltaproteobacteria bacterium]MBT8482471.1 glycosyltransferase family 4 protein [Deltaproteobacteria bacterium]NNK08213.1 glycosyltransferase [Myxococcales bacterium]
MNTKRLLWITPKWPLPANDGARQATTQLVAALCSKGCVIDLLTLLPEGEAASESEVIAALGVRSAIVVRRPKPGPSLHLRNLLRHPFRALTLSQYATKDLSRKLVQAVSEPDTVVVFDGLHTAAWLQELPRWPTVPLIFRAHDVGADLWSRAASQRKGFAARLLEWQGRAVQRFEIALCNASAIVFPVSDADTARFRQLAPRASIETLPIGMDSKPQRTRPAEDDRILFIGRLDWPPNRDGLKWFLERVWPKVTRPFALDIVGSGESSWLAPHLRDSRVKFLGQVESVIPHYHSAIVNLVPIFYGSGTRVKAIESSLFATACLSTERGVEGIGLDPKQDYFQAESESEWIEALNTLEPEAARQRGKNALARVAPRYDRDRVADHFLRTADAWLDVASTP